MVRMVHQCLEIINMMNLASTCLDMAMHVPQMLPGHVDLHVDINQTSREVPLWVEGLGPLQAEEHNIPVAARLRHWRHMAAPFGGTNLTETESALSR